MSRFRVANVHNILANASKHRMTEPYMTPPHGVVCPANSRFSRLLHQRPEPTKYSNSHVTSMVPNGAVAR